METTMSHKTSIAFPTRENDMKSWKTANPGRLAPKTEPTTLAGWRVVVGEVRMPLQPIADVQENCTSRLTSAPALPVPNEDREKHAFSIRDRTCRIGHSRHIC